MENTPHKTLENFWGNNPSSWANILLWRGQQAERLRNEAQQIKKINVGSKVYLRGLIEYSNRCSKDCYYCGIRRSNKHVIRYTLSNKEVLEAVRFAYEQGFGSVVLQSGEKQDKSFALHIEKLLGEIMQQCHYNIGITLSLGEQNKDTYRRWRDAGAKRYLLRIETSSQDLYKKLHPLDHTFAQRIKCLDYLKQTDYQVGTGVMIGLPWQEPIDLANDLQFFRQMEIDMVGMGPYIEHQQTPLYAQKDLIPSLQERYELSLNMLCLLRCLMPNINIASTTALSSLDPKGRETALRLAANVIMPNITPLVYRKNYYLYENKLCICESQEDSKTRIESLILQAGCEPAYGEHGDSQHYFQRI